MLGLNLVDLLRGKGWDLVYLVNPGSLRKRPWAKEVMKDGELIESKVEKFDGKLDVDVVFHLAAVMRGPTWQVNYLGTKNIIERVSFDKFVLVSSVLALGDSLPESASEETKCLPKTGYEMSKCEAEKLVSKLDDYLIVRPGWIYGRYSVNPDLMLLVRSVKRGFAPVLISEDLPLALVNAKDVARAMVHLVEKGATGVYNVRGPRMYKMGELIDALTSLINRKAVKVRIPRLFIKVYSLWVDVARYLLLAPTDVPIDRLLAEGFSPSIDLDDGMRETISWMRNEGLV